MRRFLDILAEAQAGITHVHDLPDDVQKKVLNAFAELANAQRDLPEMMGTDPNANPGLFNATGTFTYSAEHIGDLTHRMAQKGSEGWRYGFGWVNDKVSKCLNALTRKYGFAREVEENLQSNYRFRKRTQKLTIPFKQFREEWVEAAKRYADAHSRLTVYNEAQWHAREAAVALGRLDFDKSASHLTALKAHLSSPKKWIEYASRVTVDADGNPIPFERN